MPLGLVWLVSWVVCLAKSHYYRTVGYETTGGGDNHQFIAWEAPLCGLPVVINVFTVGPAYGPTVNAVSVFTAASFAELVVLAIQKELLW